METRNHWIRRVCLKKEDQRERTKLKPSELFFQFSDYSGPLVKMIHLHVLDEEWFV